MFFDEVFYPGNKDRKEKVLSLRGEIVFSFTNFKSTWNQNAELLNEIFKVQSPPFNNIHLKKLKYDYAADTVESCIKEINKVVESTKISLNKFIEDIGLTKELPTNWDENGVKYDPTNPYSFLNLGRFMSGIISVSLGAFVGFYIIKGIIVVNILIAYAGGMISTIGNIVAGLGGIILGASVIIITDMIFSAITGAVARKQLNDAIDALTKLKEAVTDKLNDAATKIGSINYSIKNEVYKLDDTHLLMKQGEKYVIVEIKSNNTSKLGLVDFKNNLELVNNKEKFIFIPA